MNMRIRSILLAGGLAMVSAVTSAAERDTTAVEQNVDPGMLVKSLSRHLAPVAVGESPQEIAVALPVTFDFAKATLTLAGKQLLDVAATALNDPSLVPYAFLVEGHTDAVGSDEANLLLSRKRAEAVRDYLTSKGVDRSRLTAAGFGELRLIPGVAPTDGRQRRVELVRLP